MMKNWKRLLCAALAAVMMMGLTACGSSSTTTAAAETTGSETTKAAENTPAATEAATTAAPTEAETTEAATEASEPESKTHVVVDHAGNEVEVPNEINRVVVADIYPMASVLTVFFGSADKLVGIAPPCMSAAKNGLLGELYPEILNTETGFIDGTNVNIEELMKLQPDVVFYSAGSKEEGELLRGAGIPAIAISPGKWGYDAIETLNQWIITLEQVFGESDKAEAVRKWSEEKYALVQERVAGLTDDQRRNVFFLFQYSDTSILTSGAKFFGQWWCDAIGAKNVGAEMEQDNSVAVTMEQIYAWNPDLIFITNFNTATPDDLYNNTVGNYDWSGISAIDNKQAVKMPLGLYRTYTCGADTPMTLLWLAKAAYPDLFEDIDITAETKAYYSEVFGIQLTDEQANRIFDPMTEAGSGFVIKTDK